MAHTNKDNGGDDDDHKKTSPASFIENPPELAGVCDLSQLIYLEMPHVLFNLKYRYNNMKTKFCYTSISSILLAINPYETLPIYGDDVIEQFKTAADKGRLIPDRPHPYGVSARSYMRLIQRKKNQSVIVCGESGSGKTETTKLLLKYLAVTAPSSTVDSKTIESQIVAASPILESFGNAKTVMNNNSSRFGKFTKLLYSVPDDKRCANILGAYLETYLLEKSRVVFQADNERNYHIFYFLLSAFAASASDAGDQNQNELGLTCLQDFRYINQGGVTQTFGDREDFAELVSALEHFRIGRDEQQILWQVCVGVLTLGNVGFTREGDGYASVDVEQCQAAVDSVARLWRISSEALVERLTTASVVINRKTIMKQINYEEACANRDSIAKGIYEEVFLWLCERINEELFLDEAKSDALHTFIGVLDVFGFENFWDNSLEQFCINYTNEKLQQFFNYNIIMSEQEEYLKESVMWTPLSIPDNRAYLELVEEKTGGLFALLDSQCRGPAKDDTTAFLQQLFRKHDKNVTLQRCTKAGAGNWRGTKKKIDTKSKSRQRERFQGFIVSHFADLVSYSAAEFLKKNAESVHADTFKMMKKSTLPILLQIKQAKSRKHKTVVSVFARGIRTLMKSLEKTEPYFVRCINPNQQKSAQAWNEDIVEHQLRCGGLIEALKVLKLGYPTRVPYNTLYEKYHSAVDNPLIQNMNEAAFSTALLIAFDVNETDYELGLTKIFFKPAKAAILDTIMTQAGQPLTAAQNRKITDFLVRKRTQQLLGSVRAFLVFRRRVRQSRAARAWQVSGRVASIVGATLVKQLLQTRQRILERNQRTAALLMQRAFRAHLQRTETRNQMVAYKQAVRMVWQCYVSMQQRKGVEQWCSQRRLQRVQAEQARKNQEHESITAEMAEMQKLTLAIRKSSQYVLTPKSSCARDEEVEEKERQLEQESLQQQIGNERRKQQQAMLKMREQKTQNDLRLSAARQIQRHQSIAKAMTKRELADQQHAAQAEDELEPEEEFEEDIEEKSDLSEDEFESSAEDDFDVSPLLENFEQIAKLGAKFWRHAGKRVHGKAQLRTVKVSFNADGTASTLSWGAGSRAIKLKDVWYVAWGLYTPTLVARRERLNELKCFSIVGHSEKQVLDLEAYTKTDAKLWVRGLRKLLRQSDEKADKLAEMNVARLMQYAKKQAHHAAEIKDKRLRVVKLQQDLFVMTVEAVMKELEEQHIWRIDESVRAQFDAASLYQHVLKEDVAWRQWQWYVREKITNYLRENGMVLQQPQQQPQQQPSQSSVSAFLCYYKLEMYETPLRQRSGLETLNDLQQLDEASLAQIADEVDMSVLHRNKFMAACADLKTGAYPPLEMKEMSDVEQWLQHYKLGKYAPALKENAFNTLNVVQNLSEDEITQLADECAMGVLHKKKFVAACLELKQRVKSGNKQHQKKDCLLM